MTPVEKYKTYRSVAVGLTSKMLDAHRDRDALLKSGSLLGLVRKDIFVFDSEEETSILMDFVLHEYRIAGKNAIEIYREKKGWENEIEKEILDAFLSSYTSLFKIVSVSEAENTLVLNDLLKKRDPIPLIDIAFSKTAISGLLLFIRLVPFKDFNMTSGISFVFPVNLEYYLLTRYKKLMKKVKSDSNSIQRFAAFFKLFKASGMNVRYE